MFFNLLNNTEHSPSSWTSTKVAWGLGLSLFFILKYCHVCSCKVAIKKLAIKKKGPELKHLA